VFPVLTSRHKNYFALRLSMAWIALEMEACKRSLSLFAIHFFAECSVLILFSLPILDALVSRKGKLIVEF